MLHMKTKTEVSLKLLISPQMFSGDLTWYNLTGNFMSLSLSMFFLVIAFGLDAVIDRFLNWFNIYFQFLDKLVGQLCKMWSKN